MYYGEEGYLQLLSDILNEGWDNDDRTGEGTRKVFGRMIQFDLSRSFPLLTTKKVNFNAVLGELLWMISASTNIRPLVLQGINIWNDWPLKNYLLQHGNFDGNNPKSNRSGWKREMKLFVSLIKEDEDFASVWGELGPVYGYQWRKWLTSEGKTIDQLAEVIEAIKTNPQSRRLLVTAWNPADIEEMTVSGLPPCHYGYQFNVIDGRLHCLMTQRSVDCFLGLPFNIASYALLTHMISKLCDLKPGVLTLSLGDTHIYKNHFYVVQTQLQRRPLSFPQLRIVGNVEDIDSFTTENFDLLYYQSHPALKGDIAV